MSAKITGTGWMCSGGRWARAFTFVEVMVVVVVIGILAAVVIPKFSGVSDDAKASATQGTLGGVRSSIAAFRAKAVLAGTDPYPTLAQLTTVGTVTQQAIPANPFNGSSSVQSVSRTAAASRSVSGSAGWNYFVDNSSTPPTAIFYANSNVATTIPDEGGGFKGANEL